ncbi:MAG: diguanylate cyclase, partial [Pseudomonadota bacterium]
RDEDHRQETDDSALARLADKGCLARIWLSNFSDIIKTHGDEIADDVILHTAQFLAGHIRETDIVGRLGISTFGILLGYADEQGAKAKLEKLISKLNSTPYRWKELTIPLNVRYDLMPLADMPQR